MGHKWNPSQPPFRGRVLVVGGQCSKVGKTALIVNLLSVLRDDANHDWTAVKITPHVESECAVSGPNRSCEPDEHVFAVRDEGEGASSADTRRFLTAGAARALWVRTKPGHLREALPALAHALASANRIIMESNAILEFWRPAAFFMVLDPSNPDFKPSARQALPLVDAFVLRSPFQSLPASEWRADGLSSKPTFLQLLGEPLPVDVQELARQRLGLPAHLPSFRRMDHC